MLDPGVAVNALKPDDSTYPSVVITADTDPVPYVTNNDVSYDPGQPFPIFHWNCGLVEALLYRFKL